MVLSRVIWVDSIKGLLMCLVIIGHAIQSVLGPESHSNHLWCFIYSFHMPAFMAVSGWLAYRVSDNVNTLKAEWGGDLSSCKRRALQLLVPYFVWSLIQYAQSGNYTFNNLSKMILYPDAYLWFLWVLFWIYVLFNFAQLVAAKCRINEMYTVGACCVILLALMMGAEIRMFGFQFLAYYFLFYTLGYCLHKYDWTVLSKWSCLIPLSLIWVFLAWGWTMHGLPSWMPAIQHVPSTLLQYAYRGFTASVAIVVLVGVASKLFNGNTYLNTFFCRIGIISLGLYSGHSVVLGRIKILLLYVFPDIKPLIAVIIISVIVFILAYSLVKLLEKNKHTARIFLGKF